MEHMVIDPLCKILAKYCKNSGKIPMKNLSGSCISGEREYNGKLSEIFFEIPSKE
jgi:hypothetical protein